mmetsp:Transcript_59200/g.101970  ORF Transcript_59200/g.101970 Transcript_59200/m.101970 type:complete len:222 (-) Transcript_59200:174-839(-)
MKKHTIVYSDFLYFCSAHRPLGTRRAPSPTRPTRWKLLKSFALGGIQTLLPTQSLARSTRIAAGGLEHFFKHQLQLVDPCLAVFHLGAELLHLRLALLELLLQLVLAHQRFFELLLELAQRLLVRRLDLPHSLPLPLQRCRLLCSVRVAFFQSPVQVGEPLLHGLHEPVFCKQLGIPLLKLSLERCGVHRRTEQALAVRRPRRRKARPPRNRPLLAAPDLH